MKKNVKKIIFISAFIIMLILLIALLFQYINLIQHYDDLIAKKDLLEKQVDNLKLEKEQLSKKLESSKLSGKSQTEIKQIKEQEMQEKLKSFGLEIVNTKTYWTGKRSASWIAFNSKIYPCIYIELLNTNNKRLDSVIVYASFGGGYGVAEDITDNLHPDYKAMVTIKSPVGKQPNAPDLRNMPDIEAEVSVSVNDGKKISLGLMKIDKVYKQME